MEHLRGHPVRIQLDTATAVAYVNHQGGTGSVAALLEASRILRWVEHHLPALSAVHIPGVDNLQAEYLSRQTLDQGQ